MTGAVLKSHVKIHWGNWACYNNLHDVCTETTEEQNNEEGIANSVDENDKEKIHYIKYKLSYRN